jgi:hypothetical protein
MASNFEKTAERKNAAQARHRLRSTGPASHLLGDLRLSNASRHNHPRSFVNPTARFDGKIR